MKHLSEEIKKELQEELLDEKEVALLFALKESILPNHQFVKELKKKLVDHKYSTPSPWQIFFTQRQALTGFVFLLVTTPLVFMLIKNTDYLKINSPTEEKSILQKPSGNMEADFPKFREDAQLKPSNQNVESAQLKTMTLPSTLSFDRVRQEAAKKLNTPLGQISIQSYEEKIWPDTCLGLSKKKNNCLAVSTPGFLITLQVGTSTIIYRTDKEENVILRQ